MSGLSSPLRFLCIDDDHAFLDYFLSLIRPFNVLIDTCDTIRVAKEKMQALRYDAYIIDLNLPDGLGIELIEMIRKDMDKKTPIVAISSVYKDDDTFRMLKEKYAVNFVLDKPVYPEQVYKLFLDICQSPASMPQDDLQEIKSAYAKNIPDKISLLADLIRSAQSQSGSDSLQALKEAVHKLAGNAGSYGYPQVSLLCKGLECRIDEILNSKNVMDQDWLFSLDSFLSQIKYAFQVSALNSNALERHSSKLYRLSLYVIDSDVQLLQLLEREKENYGLDLEVESDPHRAIERLSLLNFNPQMVVISQSCKAAGTDWLQIVHKMRQKPHLLRTIFGILLDEDHIDIRMDAIKNGVEYIFRKPFPADLLFKTALDALQRKSARHFKALILDNDPNTCHFILTTLSEIGLNARFLCEASHLYQVLEEYQPDFLFLSADLEKYGGLDLLKTLRLDPMFQNLVILMLAEAYNPLAEMDMYMAKADEILYRPLNKETLIGRMACLMERHAYFRCQQSSHEFIGLQKNKALQLTLHDALLGAKQTIKYLALFEVDQMDSWSLKKGRAFVNELLIFISNFLQRSKEDVVEYFFCNSSKFAALFHGDDLNAVELRMYNLLFAAQFETGFNINFCCGIVPVHPAFGGENGVIAAAEKALNQAYQEETSPIKIAVLLPEGEEASKKEIMLVDPDIELLDLLKTAFEFHGLAVKTFQNGTEALQNLPGKMPALVIAERQLNDMDGLELLKQLKAHYKMHLPFFFLTAFSSDQDIHEGLHRGALDYISKPFNLSLLIQKALIAIFERSPLRPHSKEHKNTLLTKS